LSATPFKAYLCLQSHPKRVLLLGGEIMQSGQWVLLLIDLMGGGAVIAALAIGLVSHQILREMKKLAD
jgi:hypothetical protein